VNSRGGFVGKTSLYFRCGFFLTYSTAGGDDFYPVFLPVDPGTRFKDRINKAEPQMSRV
jgi:hypothetical protein